MKFKLTTEGGSVIYINSYAEDMTPDEVVVEINGRLYKISIMEVQ